MANNYVCSRCKNRVPLSEIRYTQDGSSLVCKACYALDPNPSDDPTARAPTPNDPEDLDLLEDMEDPTEEILKEQFEVDEDQGAVVGRSAAKRVSAVHDEEVDVPKDPSRRITYLCVGCRYKFTIGRKSRVAKKCPYCGKGELLEVTDVSTDEMIDEY